jgi:hypothetical protein
LRNYYHDTLSNGKWDNMMNQTHISYTYWQQPEKDVLPDVITVQPGSEPEMGIVTEGAREWWPQEKTEPVLPEFDKYNRQKHYIEVFNRGEKPFDFNVIIAQPWLKSSEEEGTVDDQVRIWIEVDWNSVPAGIHRVPVEISGPGDKSVKVFAVVRNPESPDRDKLFGHVENNGVVSIGALHYNKANANDQIHWQVIPDLGRTGSSVTPFPVTAPGIDPGGNSPRLEYKVHLFDTGRVKVMVYVAPTLNFTATEGLKYAVSFDNEEPQIVNIHEADTIPDWNYPSWWNNAVTQNCKILTSDHEISAAGEHTLKYWMVDPAIVLEKIVIDAGGLKPSYLGPPESYYRIK